MSGQPIRDGGSVGVSSRGWLQGACGRAFAAAAIATAVLLVDDVAMAQATRPPAPPVGVTPSAQELDPARTAAQRRGAKARSDDLFSRPPAGACPLRDSPLTFRLRSVSFTGADAIAAKDLASVYKDAVGQVVRVGAICDIRDRTAALLFSRGILARVEIPEQRIAGGDVRLEVVEARIAAVRIRGDAGPAQAQVEAYLERLRGMAPFDLNTAQRYLLLAADIPGVRVNAALRPSPEGRGAVDLDVTVSRDAVDVLVNAQNLGSKAIGRGGVLARADFNGFTPWGERTSLVVYSTFDEQEQELVQLAEEARLGDQGLLVRGSLAYAVSHPGDALKPLHLEGVSLVGEIELAYPIIRKRRSSLNLLGGFDYVDQKTDFGSGGVLVDDHLRIAFGRVEAGARQAFGLPIDVTGSLEARHGLKLFDASPIGQVGLSRTEGHPQAWVYRLEGQVDAQPLSWLGAHLSAQGQYSDKPLLSYEQLSLGNLTIGRGYDPSSTSGDRGVALSTELRAGPFSPLPWLRVAPYAFYDVGYLEDLSLGGDNRRVSSAGGGLRLRVTDRVTLDVAYANPFDKPFKAAASRPSPRVLVNLTAAF